MLAMLTRNAESFANAASGPIADVDSVLSRQPRSRNDASQRSFDQRPLTAFASTTALTALSNYS